MALVNRLVYLSLATYWSPSTTTRCQNIEILIPTSLKIIAYSQKKVEERSKRFKKGSTLLPTRSNSSLVWNKSWHRAILTDLLSVSLVPVDPAAIGDSVSTLLVLLSLLITPTRCPASSFFNLAAEVTLLIDSDDRLLGVVKCCVTDFSCSLWDVV